MTAANIKEPNGTTTSASILLELLNDTEVLVRNAQTQVAFAKYAAEDEGWPGLAHYMETLQSALDPILDLVDDMLIHQLNTLYHESDVTTSSQLSLFNRQIGGSQVSPTSSEKETPSAIECLPDIDMLPGFDIPSDQCDDAAGLVMFLEDAEVLIRTAQEGISTARFGATEDSRAEIVESIATLERKFIPVLGTTFMMTKTELDDFIDLQRHNYDAKRLGLIYQQIHAIQALEHGKME